MSAARALLKVISVLLIICAVIEIVLGVLLVIGAALPEMATTFISYGGETFTEAEGALGFGVIFIFLGIIYVCIGSLGLRGARHPKKIGPFFWLAIIGAILSVLGLIFGFIGGTLSPASAISTVIVIVCAILAGIIRSKNKSMTQEYADRFKQ